MPCGTDIWTSDVEDMLPLAFLCLLEVFQEMKGIIRTHNAHVGDAYIGMAVCGECFQHHAPVDIRRPQEDER